MKATLDDVRKLLLAMEREVRAPIQILVIEIPSLSLVLTNDNEAIDQIRTAHGNASARLKLAIPLQIVAPSNFPFLYETRFTPLATPGLNQLQPQIVDRHDAVVSKILLGERRDLGAIQTLARQSGLTFESLVDSFCAIDTTSVSDIRKARASFLELIEVLFGKNSAMQAEASLAERLG